MKPDCPTFDKTWRAACSVERTDRGNAGKISGIPIALDETVEKWELVE